VGSDAGLHELRRTSRGLWGRAFQLGAGAIPAWTGTVICAQVPTAGPSGGAWTSSDFVGARAKLLEIATQLKRRGALMRQEGQPAAKRVRHARKTIAEAAPNDVIADLAAAQARIAELEARLERQQRIRLRDADGVELTPVDRRDLILGTAGRLFAERGFFNTTTRDIADEVGIKSGSLYHHFASKEEMVDQIIRDYNQDLMAGSINAVDGVPPLEGLRRLVETVIQMIERNRVAAAILRNDGVHLRQLPRFAYLDEVAQQIHEIWLGVIEDGKREGQVRHDVDSDVIYRFILDSLSNWNSPRGSVGLEEMSEFYIGLIFEGVRAP
jgi:TetR/AcrR family transcriptional regulator, cholesterol catabolism regulator